MLRSRHQATVAQALEQVVNRLEAHQHAEFAFEDLPDIGAAQGADAILGTRRGIQASLQVGVSRRVQERRSSATGSVVEGFDPTGVVLGDPVLDGLEGTPK